MKDREGWPRLEAKANWLLEHPDQIGPLDALQGRTLVLRLWGHRRLVSRVSWGLFVSEREDGQSLVREVTWGESADLLRMNSRLVALKRRAAEGPSIRVRDAVVDPTALGPFLHEAGKVLPAAETIDPAGHEFGIEGYRDLAFVRMAWSGEDSGAFRDAAAWTDRLRAVLEASLRDRETA